MSDRLNVTLIGSKFMGRAHSNGWAQVPHFIDVPRHPVLRSVPGDRLPPVEGRLDDQRDPPAPAQGGELRGHLRAEALGGRDCGFFFRGCWEMLKAQSIAPGPRGWP